MTKKRPNNSISRRDTLRLIGAAGATAIVGLAGAPAAKILPGRGRGATAEASSFPRLLAPQQTCIVRPQLTEGPYFVDERLNRSDIRPDPTTGSVEPGVPLVLRFNVSRVSGNSCAALAGAFVDIWHCDAAGNYSDISGGAGQGNTLGQKFLRGYQVTDSGGAVEFQTIYPGWYPGRATHIHFINGTREKKTDNDAANPRTVLIARKAGKKIDPDQTVALVVRNSDNTDSNTFLFTRPL